MKRMMTFFLMMFMTVTIYGENIKLIELPAPKRTGGIPLMDALNKRSSSRDFSERELSDQVLSNLLWAAFGINRDNGKRTAPSSQGKTEMEIYVATGKGLFLYIPEKNALEQVLDKDIRKKTGKQLFVNKAPVNLIFVANYKKAGNTNSEKYRSTSGMNTGFISQNVYLYCASEGLATVVRGWFDNDSLRKAMNLEDYKDIILTQTVGYPK